MLLFDKHSTHIDLEISKLCREKDILLYCLPAHSSHITQPLDVGFFKPLKVNWAHAVDISMFSLWCLLTKHVLLRFLGKHGLKRESTHHSEWLAAAGVCPIDRRKALGDKTAPSTIFTPQEETSAPPPNASQLALKALEEELDEGTLVKFQERFEEGYDVTSDSLYNTWLKLKQHTLEDYAASGARNYVKQNAYSAKPDSGKENPIPELKSLHSPALDEILTYLNHPS